MSVGLVLRDRYELRVRLGSGGAGTVWRAFDTTLHRDVAVKLITLDGVPMDSDYNAPIQRFRREARSMAALNHPNLVAAYDFGVHDNVAFLVMELIDGASLAEGLRRLRGEGAVGYDEATVVRMAQQVCAGLAVAHRARLVHRDLKPSNLMVAQATGRVKIVDFGIARIAEQSRLTRTGSYLGTLPYTAPEQMDDAPIDGRADLYSLGCVLHELLTGRSPYDASTPLQWMAAHQHGTPTPLRRHLPEAAPELESLLLRLLAKSPVYRPADAEAVFEALADITERYDDETERPILMPPVSQTLLATITVEPALIEPAPDGAPASASTTTTPMLAPVSPAPGPVTGRRITPLPSGFRGMPAGSPGPPMPAGLPGPPLSGGDTQAPSGQFLPPPPPSASDPQAPGAYLAAFPRRRTAPAGSPAPAGPLTRPPPPSPTAARRRRARVWWVIIATVVVLLLAATGVAIALDVLGPGRGSPVATPGVSPGLVRVAPVTGACFADGWASAVDADRSTIWAATDRIAASGCTTPHAFEVVGVATVNAAAAQASAPPGPASALVRGAYAACVTAADAYLGGNWRLAYVWVGVAYPDAEAWGGGARWRACVLHPTSTWQGTPTVVSTGLRDGLRGTRPAAITCFDTDKGTPKDCGTPHTDEVVGVFPAPAGSWPGPAVLKSIDRAGCETQVAHYLGLISANAWHSSQLGWSWWSPTREQWELGNRMAICSAHAFTANGVMVGSVRGIGNQSPDD